MEGRRSHDSIQTRPPRTELPISPPSFWHITFTYSTLLTSAFATDAFLMGFHVLSLLLLDLLSNIFHLHVVEKIVF